MLSAPPSPGWPWALEAMVVALGSAIVRLSLSGERPFSVGWMGRVELRAPKLQRWRLLCHLHNPVVRLRVRAPYAALLRSSRAPRVVLARLSQAGLVPARRRCAKSLNRLVREESW